MREYSYGIIPLKYNDSLKGWEVLLVQHHGGYWAFPKGHANEGESSKETAARELKEETGLIVEHYLLDDILRENYVFSSHKKKIHKTVFYFIASVRGEVILQKEEILGSCWLPLNQAMDQMTFPEGRNLCIKTIKLLKNSGL